MKFTTLTKADPSKVTTSSIHYMEAIAWLHVGQSEPVLAHLRHSWHFSDQTIVQLLGPWQMPWWTKGPDGSQSSISVMSCNTHAVCEAYCGIRTKHGEAEAMIGELIR